MNMNHPAARLGAALLLLLLTGASALFAATGLPVLDPSGGSTGTGYSLVISGSARPIDAPPSGVSQFRVIGTLLLFQDQADDHFDAEMEVDTDEDSVLDRSLICHGIVGNGRFGLHCDEDDGGADLKLSVTGRAIMLPTGRITLRDVTGVGYTPDDLLKLAIKGTQN